MSERWGKCRRCGGRGEIYVKGTNEGMGTQRANSGHSVSNNASDSNELDFRNGRELGNQWAPSGQIPGKSRANVGQKSPSAEFRPESEKIMVHEYNLNLVPLLIECIACSGTGQSGDIRDYLEMDEEWEKLRL